MTRSVFRSATVLVFASESITYAAVYQASSDPRHARRCPPGPGRADAGSALAACEGALRRRVGAPGGLPRARRDARALDPPPPRREGRRPRALASRAAREPE